jgi:hypothetical protein
MVSGLSVWLPTAVAMSAPSDKMHQFDLIPFINKGAFQRPTAYHLAIQFDDNRAGINFESAKQIQR